MRRTRKPRPWGSLPLMPQAWKDEKTGPLVTGRRAAYLRPHLTCGARSMAHMDAAVLEHRAGRMSGAAFRDFQAKRPDHERWELLRGVPMMMTPPTLMHNQIATNLQRLLNDALE